VAILAVAAIATVSGTVVAAVGQSDPSHNEVAIKRSTPPGKPDVIKA
jgi:hypothetical protein